MSTLSAKSVAKKFKAKSQREGAGFVVRRPIGGRELSDAVADPFLMLDELGPVVYAKGEFPGAPTHPHRGFDTVMYLIAGEGEHSDSAGNHGTLRAGDVQWMTAASGIIHDEGRNHPGGLLHGFQMWVNLPRANKMDPPAYQNIPADRIPLVGVAPGVQAKIIAGVAGGVHAVVKTVIPIQYIDFVVEPGATFTHEIPEEMETAIAYCYQGRGTFGTPGTAAEDGDTMLLGAGQALTFTGGDSGMRFLLLAGKPIREPIARYGPFVMNTREEIETAFREYQEGTFVKHKGIERSLEPAQ